MPFPRLISVVIICAVIVTLACEDDDPPATISISGEIRDEITGLPLEGVEIYSCPGTYQRLVHLRIYEKRLKGVSDACGRFSVTIPVDEARYTNYDTEVEAIVLLYQSCGYGDMLNFERAVDNSDLEIALRRPYFDSLRWSFNAKKTTLTVEAKTNQQMLRYYFVVPHSDPSSESWNAFPSDGSFRITDLASGETLSAPAVANGWTSLSVPDLELENEYKLVISPGTNRSLPTCNEGMLREVHLNITPNNRSVDKVYVLPKEQRDSCD